MEEEALLLVPVVPTSARRLRGSFPPAAMEFYRAQVDPKAHGAASVRDVRRIDVTGSAKKIDAGLKEKIDAELREIAKQTEALLKDLRALSARGSAKKRPSGDIPRPSPLDELIGEMKATADLREDGGNLSAEKIADLFGLSRKRLAELLRRTRQGVHRTPDAESLQRPLEYFERIARLRVALGGSAREQGASFRKWLKTPNARLGRERPLDWICARRWQAMADLVDDILSGSPS